MSRRSTKYWRCSSASGVNDSLAKTEHRKSSMPGRRSKNRNNLENYLNNNGYFGMHYDLY